MNWNRSIKFTSCAHTYISGNLYRTSGSDPSMNLQFPLELEAEYKENKLVHEKCSIS